jgi:hypothetical protein
MPSKKLLAVILPTVLLISACGTSSTDLGSSTDSGPVDILERLESEGSITWSEDRFASVTDTTVEHIYFGDGCTIWQFPSYAEAEAANKGGQFNFYKGEAWYGEDAKSGKGVTLLTESKTSTCAKLVFQVLDWSTEGDDENSDSASMSGKWGSYSWMDDGVGAFLVVKSLGGNDYVGTFYTQGQSGGVFKDSTVQISDSGDGLAEVTWPSGSINTATWGKRRVT